jgi:maltose phosphorylase
VNQYLKTDEWKIIEKGFNPENHRASESIFSIGNGNMGQRANFEENYSGSTLQGSYIAGVYYPDKTRVGWWKNGYPEYYAKVLNAANWIGIQISIDGEELDLAVCQTREFVRELNMKEGTLKRSFIATLPSGKEIKADILRFVSMVHKEAGAIKYKIIPLNFSGKIKVHAYIDGDVKNEDSNYNEKFWNEVKKDVQGNSGFVTLETKKTAFQVCTAMTFKILNDGKQLPVNPEILTKTKYIGSTVEFEVGENKEISILKYAVNLSSENHSKEKIEHNANEVLDKIVKKGFDTLLKEHIEAWVRKWEDSDIVIEGDPAAQQGIRFNIFQLHQTYTGDDPRLNIGPKGFTGEKYGGSTYWDTEAYCLPFFMNTSGHEVAKNLLVYRFNHLQKAIENAEKLGFRDGAGLYPMVTMNGEECHNEWEITFEEIHRNGAIAYAIYNYIRHTNDKNYLSEYGLEVLVAIARFWKQRVNFSEEKKKFVILGVTGPNEYENNVNNNWYTNFIASWCMEYAVESAEYVKKSNPDHYKKLVQKMNFDEAKETADWKNIIKNMYYPKEDNLGIFLQQDGFMDKEQILVKDLDPKIRPINQHWSWDRILRSVFIKQADVLQGLYFFEHKFDLETIKRNYDFYEARTVHESSLSPCVHSILAAKTGNIEKAYELYLRTSRLDLDDYNKEVAEGLHITSMAGTWMSIVEGFGGMRVIEDQLHFNPLIPHEWSSYSFHIRFRGRLFYVTTTHNEITIRLVRGEKVNLVVHGKDFEVDINKDVLLKN